MAPTPKVVPERAAGSKGWAGELAFAVDLARRAGEVLQAGYENVGRIEHKSRRDVVTDVDYRSEELVISAIRERYPADAILAEESGKHDGKRRRRANAEDTHADDGRTWVIDPLDGTVNYANGIPFYCVSIGLVAGGQPVVGVVLDPARNDLYTATADGPARLNGAVVRASGKGSLDDYVVSLAIIGRGGIWRERRIAKAIRIGRRMGSSALGLAYVAGGRFDAMIQNGGLSLWDVAAAGLIAERSGARITALDGGPWWSPGRRSGTVSIVAAPQPHHAELLRLLREAGTTVGSRRP
jgi:myo-inositol-1(or 4)-monophosphatase